MLDVFYLVRHREESRMPVHLAVRRLEERHLLAGRRRRDVSGPDDPDAHALVAPRVHIARILDRHLRIRRVQAADVLVREPVLASDEDFPKRPFRHSPLLKPMLTKIPRHKEIMPADLLGAFVPWWLKILPLCSLLRTRSPLLGVGE